tara:strand:- start:288 stop:464 length:177 start_codon:yes stop_codon:yes gene_type:complete
MTNKKIIKVEEISKSYITKASKEIINVANDFRNMKSTSSNSRKKKIEDVLDKYLMDLT